MDVSAVSDNTAKPGAVWWGDAEIAAAPPAKVCPDCGIRHVNGCPYP